MCFFLNFRTFRFREHLASIPLHLNVKNLEPLNLLTLADSLEGKLLIDNTSRLLYATDASVYREKPLAVALPAHKEDLIQLIHFVRSHNLSLIPRGAGTSLAGQCVGNGIVIDFSSLNQVIHFDKKAKTVTVQPGMIRDELNRILEKESLFFSPITSTSNRATIGGMVGNNSSGTTSIKYGVTRDKIVSLKVLLHDGSEIICENLDATAFYQKCELENTEGKIYRFFRDKLHKDNKQIILDEFPSPSIHRRNTGYALDEVLNYNSNEVLKFPFNLGKLLAGSEGTLGIITEITCSLDDVQPPLVSVVATHCASIKDALLSTKIAMEYAPYKCELMDKIILDCTKDNAEQMTNRFFVKGDPKGVLMVEFRSHHEEELHNFTNRYIHSVDQAKLAYHHTIINGKDTSKVWALRSAGLGLLANIPGDKKAVACVEDTAVSLEDLPAYIEEFTALLDAYNQKAVYYAHAGAGELHLRPILNLKEEKDRQLFYQITKETALLVKKFKGSLSGEHGDGRVRAPFIPIMVGPEVYNLFIQLKSTFDPYNIFNPGKIVHAKAMTEDLRTAYAETSQKTTTYNFNPEGGFLRAVEKCNGSGDCRKLPEEDGVMCPSFHATRNEKDTTRARANILREFISTGESTVSYEEVKDVLDLCLSCKACKSECPSGVDMAAMKAEFMHQYHHRKGISRRQQAFASVSRIHKFFQFAPYLHNVSLRQKLIATPIKKLMGIATKRSIPSLHKSLVKWAQKRPLNSNSKKLYLYVDEFTNYLDTEIGKKAVELLEILGYSPIILQHPESGRAEISKGFLSKAKSKAEENIHFWKDKVSQNCPLVGIEPSTILGFRDEYLRLVDDSILAEAKKIAKHCYTIEEFISTEYKKGNIQSNQFSTQPFTIKLHVHCHQKALSSIQYSIDCLSLPSQVHIDYIPAGCCGMAGSFGYEKEHYDISMKIGEMILFPTIRKSSSDFIVAAGTSCRHQILDGTNKNAIHPVEFLWHTVLKK